jgi:hypothetical protein
MGGGGGITGESIGEKGEEGKGRPVARRAAGEKNKRGGHKEAMGTLGKISDFLTVT